MHNLIKRLALWLAMLTYVAQPIAAGAQGIDPAARGLAIQAKAAAAANTTALNGRTLRGEKLRRLAMAALSSNPDLAAPITDGSVSITTSATLDSTLTKIYNGATLTNFVRFTGGSPRYVSGGNAWYFPVASNLPATDGNTAGVGSPVTNDMNAWGWQANFQVDCASKVAIRIGNGAANKGYRVIVDNRYVTTSAPTAYSYTGTNYIFLTLDGKPHHITFETGGQIAFASISVSPDVSVTVPRKSADSFLILNTGDSYGEGQGNTYVGFPNFAQVFGRAVGATDVRQVAVGGTGYFNANGTRSTIRAQIPNWFTVNSDIAPSQVDAVLLFGSFNDYSRLQAATITSAQLTAEVALTIKAIRAATPNALIIVGGTWGGLRGPDATTLQLEAAVLAGYNTAADPLSMYVPISNDTVPWQSGDGQYLPLTAALSSATSATLTQPFYRPTGTYNLLFSDGSIKSATLTNGSTAVSWTGAVTGAAYVSAYVTIRGNSNFLLSYDGVHPNDLGHAYLAKRLEIWYRSILSGQVDGSGKIIGPISANDNHLLRWEAKRWAA